MCVLIITLQKNFSQVIYFKDSFLTKQSANFIKTQQLVTILLFQSNIKVSLN